MPDERKRVAPNAVLGRLRHGQHRGSRNRRVDRVAAAPKGAQPRLRGQRVARRDHRLPCDGRHPAPATPEACIRTEDRVEVELHDASIAACSVLTVQHPFDVEKTRQALSERGGGYEVVHASPGLEIGVYVLVAPEPDRQQPHEYDEVYIVLEGSGVLEVEGVSTPLEEGGALFVAAGDEHRLTADEDLWLLVICSGPQSATKT